MERRSALAVLLAAALIAGCSNAPKQCRTDPKGWICREYHVKKLQAEIAKHEKEMRLHPPKPGKVGRPAGKRSNGQGATIKVVKEENE